MQYFSVRQVGFFLIAITLSISISPTADALPLQNSDFASGLSGWNSGGNVSAVVQEAILSDVTDIGSNPFARLYQITDVVVGESYALELDFVGRFSDDRTTDPFAFPDTFYATLLTGDAASDLDPDAPLGSAQALFDLSIDGTNDYVGSFGPSAKGSEWTHYRYEFIAGGAFLSVLFELDDLNFVLGDSAVRLDNVTLTAKKTEVPEPATAAMLLLGIPIIRRRWNVRHK